MTGQYIPKRRDACILFLDDAFESADADELVAGGFCGVELFRTWFKAEDGSKEQSVKDPRILKFCNAHKWLLVTSDSNIRFTHVEEIKKLKDLAIIATAHNSLSDISPWVKGLIKARPEIERHFKKRQRPWFAQFNTDGKITTIYTVSERHYTRRDRPGEK